MERFINKKKAQKRILEKYDRSAFQGIRISKLIEARARRIDFGIDEPTWNKSPLAIIKREIALTIDRIDEARTLEKLLRDSLLDVECKVGTEILSIDQRSPQYSSRRFPEREKFQRRLFEIEAERRKHKVKYRENIEKLHSHLLSLLHKRMLLDF